MKHSIIALIIVATIIGNTSCVNAEARPESYNPKELEQIIVGYSDRMDAAHDMAEAARRLGYEEDHHVIQLAKQEYADAREQQAIHQQTYSLWQEKVDEYPVASKVWETLKDAGYTDCICAGIIGNMMVETGDNTLAIKWDSYSEGRAYYGLCQWSSRYYPQIQGADFDTQCQFLMDTIAQQLDTYGFNYSRGFNYEKFCALDSAYDAGYAFGACYERGAGNSLRGKCATTAYEYFTS